MYNYMDASGFLPAIYFPLCVVLGSFFLLHLFLAVIMETFSEQVEKQKLLDQKKEMEKMARMKTMASIRFGRGITIDKMINVAKKKLEVHR